MSKTHYRWGEAPLRELVDPERKITYGIVQPGEWQEEGWGVPLIRGQDYSSGVVDVENLRYVHPSIAAPYARSTVKPGDLLFSIVGYVGLCAEVPNEAGGANITQTTARVAPRDGLDGRFLLHYFRSKAFHSEVKKYTKGSAQPGLNLADVEKMVVKYPVAVCEQHKIAQILDTLDTQIRQTEALIAKLETVKQGMLTDLLTRGIDENGQLRPPPKEAPELYKESPLGQIPRGWDYASWGECTESWAMGPRFSAEKYTEDGNVATLRTTDMDSEGGVNHATMPIAQLDLRGLEQHILRVGDFVITRSGTCGVCGVFHGHNLPVLPGAFLIRFRFDTSKLDAEFMAMLMNSHVGRPLVARNAEGGVQKNLRGTSLLKISFAKPPVGEQVEIRLRVESVAGEIENLRADLRKLGSQKSGLMDDLLTGRVRVTPLLGTAKTSETRHP
ncbi:restriction endonuclease subunit S [Guyparkeria sp. 1SP6A2]|nr:restriction endonuclease subunit S [Guyparkeria sp. 1SP6A2]